MSTRPYAERKNDFFHLVDTARQLNIPHPEIIAAQWALESDWGRKQTGQYNYFGIKAGNGDPSNNEKGTVSWTRENINGKDVRLRQKFKDYHSLEEALLDRSAFTGKKGGRYDKAGYFTATSLADAAMALQRGNYATDRNYAESLINVMKGMGIDPYDGKAYDYSTTSPAPTAALPQGFDPTAMQQAFTPPAGANWQPDADTPLDDFTQNFNQINRTLEAFTPPPELEPVNYQKQYQKQLASAFGVMPPTPQHALPHYIGDLVKSIYDQA